MSDSIRKALLDKHEDLTKVDAKLDDVNDLLDDIELYISREHSDDKRFIYILEKTKKAQGIIYDAREKL